MPDLERDITKDQLFKLFQKQFSAEEQRALLRDKLRKSTRLNLYEISPYLRERTREELGVYLKDVYVYLQDPLVATINPDIGIRPVKVRWEPGLIDGPTSARLAVVDYNIDSGCLYPCALWNKTEMRFEGPDDQPLGLDQSNSFQFHQVCVWAIVQSVLDIYESPFALGRPIPWGTDGHRLIIVPHAGFGENAYYDRRSKSLQFYYYGTTSALKFTCLSHDIVAHETGHAILDGIRPYYYDYTSVQTAAFHEFIADLTAILSALRNNDIRRQTGIETKGDLSLDNVINAIAEEFGEHLTGVKKLRDAKNPLTMQNIRGYDSPHHCSQVLTGAVYDILEEITLNYLKGEDSPKTPPLTALWWATQRIFRMALQPIDLCPPVDIQFIDYAKAVLHNFAITEPADSPKRGYYDQLIRRVFHERKLCEKPLKKCEKHPEECHLRLEEPPSRWDIYHDIESISQSHTSAYYFLHDNRRRLKIPLDQDIFVSEVYETNKYTRGARRLPREIVIQYIWREEFKLEGSRFGSLEGRNAELLCGGTLVLDGRGNIISWLHKPGMDSAEGIKRRENLENHIARQIELRTIGIKGEMEVDVFGPWTSPVVAEEQVGALRLELTPHIRNTIYMSPDEIEKDIEDKRESSWREEEWTMNF
ncbi:MAG: hypothetical protein KAH97_00300 [Anaerolineales bacterium]|nr:hypothetical protein [Anaerolineales bacterium]